MCGCDVQCVVYFGITESFGARVLSPKKVDADVLGDAVEPSVKCGIAFEFSDGVVCFDKGVLCQVLCCLSVVYLRVNEASILGNRYFVTRELNA